MNIKFLKSHEYVPHFFHPLEFYCSKLYSFPLTVKTQHLFYSLFKDIEENKRIQKYLKVDTLSSFTYKVGIAKVKDRPDNNCVAFYNIAEDCIMLYGREAWNLGTLLHEETHAIMCKNGLDVIQEHDHDDFFWETLRILTIVTIQTIEQERRFEVMQDFLEYDPNLYINR